MTYDPARAAALKAAVEAEVRGAPKCFPSGHPPFAVEYGQDILDLIVAHDVYAKLFADRMEAADAQHEDVAACLARLQQLVEAEEAKRAEGPAPELVPDKDLEAVLADADAAIEQFWLIDSCVRQWPPKMQLEVWRVKALVARLRRYEAGLQEVLDPIARMRREAEAQGGSLNGGMAVRLADDPNHLRGIADKALGAERECPHCDSGQVMDSSVSTSWRECGKCNGTNRVRAW